MKTGLLRKLAAAGIAMLMLITLASGISQAAGDITVNVDVNVTITYNANYPDGPGYMKDTHTHGHGKSYKVKKNPFTRPGYEFECWNTQPDGKGTTYTTEQLIIVNVNIILYAQWKPGPQPTLHPTPKPTPQPTPLTTFTITYRANYPGGGGPVVMTDKSVQGSSYVIWSNPFTVPAGYTFAGWNTRAILTDRGTAYTAGDIITVNANITLFAQWKAVPTTATVIYKPNYPAGGGPGDITDSNLDLGSAYQIRYNNNSVFAPPASDYIFAGWNTQANGSGTAYTAGDIITVNANITLYAQWTQLPKFTVIYKSNYLCGPADQKDADLVQGDAYQIRYITNAFKPPAGYIFAGWNTLANGKGTAYTEGQIITVNANLTLYAQWTKQNKCTVTYKSNYPGGCGPANKKDDNLVKNDAYQIRHHFFTPPAGGYTFAGWNTLANGKGTAYEAGLVITVSVSITLYAQWRK